MDLEPRELRYAPPIDDEVEKSCEYTRKRKNSQVVTSGFYVIQLGRHPPCVSRGHFISNCVTVQLSNSLSVFLCVSKRSVYDVIVYSAMSVYLHTYIVFLRFVITTHFMMLQLSAGDIFKSSVF